MSKITKSTAAVSMAVATGLGSVVFLASPALAANPAGCSTQAVGSLGAKSYCNTSANGTSHNILVTCRRAANGATYQVQSGRVATGKWSAAAYCISGDNRAGYQALLWKPV